MDGCVELDMESQDQERLIWHSPNIVALCIDSYDEKQQKGRIYHQYTAEPLCFTTLFSALQQMDHFYDSISYPYASVRIRSFFVDRKAGGRALEDSLKTVEYKRKDMVKMESFHNVTGQRGTDATFIVRVMYRQHASWQGEVTWIDGQKKEYFRSALELVRLIDGALGKTEQGSED